MFCILSLARTASTYTVHLVHAARYLQAPQTQLAAEPFNPRYNTIEDIERKYARFVSMDPLPVMKIISGHDISLSKRVLTEGKFKTIFTKPKNLQAQILKALIGKTTDKYIGERKLEREPFIKKLSFTQEEVDERVMMYKQHMSIKQFCDYVFDDEFIVTNPSSFIEQLGMEYVKPNYNHISPFYDDYMMLKDVDEFVQKYKNSCDKFIGGVV